MGERWSVLRRGCDLIWRVLHVVVILSVDVPKAAEVVWPISSPLQAGDFETTTEGRTWPPGWNCIAKAR
jgi:hypothetical protein